MRKVISILIFSFLLLNITSCYDAEEIDDLLFVNAMGVDKGISDKWRLTLVFPALQESGSETSGSDEQSGDGGSSGGQAYISIDAPTFFTGIDMLNTSLPKKLNFTQTQLIIINEDILKDGEIGQFIAPLGRFEQIRKSAHVYVVRGEAQELLKEFKPIMGTTLSKSFQLFIQIAEETGFFSFITFENFYESIKSHSHSALLPLAAKNDFKTFKKSGDPWGTKHKSGGGYIAGEIPRIGQNKIDVFGTAVFDGYKMAGILNGDETRFLLMARGDFKRGFFTIPDPKKPELALPLDIRAGRKPEVKVSLRDSKPFINLKVQLDGEILAVQSMIDYEQPSQKKLLEQEFKKVVQSGIEDVIRKCQRLNSDVFNFGDYAARNFLTIGAFEKYDWNSRFKDAEVKVDVTFIIRRTGTQIKSFPLKDPVGEEE